VNYTETPSEFVGLGTRWESSAQKGRDKRPGFDALCKDATRRRFDMVRAWSVDRLGRSLQDLVAFLAEIHGAKVDLFLHQQGVDTTTAGGKALFQMIGVFAEFERAMIRDRVNAGLARVKATGKTKIGKPIERPRISADTELRIRAAWRMAKWAFSELRSCVGTVQRLKTEVVTLHSTP
jgi:DNA invertase Pin-like site-specific DNA recombinase